MIAHRLGEFSTSSGGSYPLRLYVEPERAAIARGYHGLFRKLGIVPVPGRKLYRFDTRLGPAESSIDVSARMAYIYFRYLDVERAAKDYLPSDPRYRASAFNPHSGKLNCHVAADQEKSPLPAVAMEMVEGFGAILADLEARPLAAKQRSAPLATRYHPHPSL
jgi:hypothetical protein